MAIFTAAQIAVIIVLLLIICVGMPLLVAGIIRAAGNASRAEERWAKQDPSFKRVVEEERSIAAALEEAKKADPDDWDFKHGQPRS